MTSDQVRALANDVSAAIHQVRPPDLAMVQTALREYADLLDRTPALRHALQAILNEPYGCTLCDSGKSRRTPPEHQPDCPYELARAALGLPPEQAVAASPGTGGA